ncbi:hypothetical protein NMG60_11014874 [Bertholletia excelsa]
MDPDLPNAPHHRFSAREASCARPYLLLPPQNPNKTPDLHPSLTPLYPSTAIATMSAAAVARSVFRSSAVRSAGARLAEGAKPKAPRSPLRLPTRKPFSSRIFRSPVGMSSVCVDSMLPFYTATASALLTSMLSVAPRCYGWTAEGQEKTR